MASRQPAPDSGSIYTQIKTIADQGRYPLSFTGSHFKTLGAYRRAVRAKVLDLFHYEPPRVAPRPRVVERWEGIDYIQEKIEISTTPWFRVPAYVLIPKGGSKRKAAVLDLHSHGGMFVYGKEKVMPTPVGRDTPALAAYRLANYEGRSTSLALCRRGYVVISPDAFYFGERRTMSAIDAAKHGWDRDKYSLAAVRQLNGRASQGESVLARSLFWAGATWPGVVHWDDMRTLDYLQTRSDVDPGRIGCVGVSMGGDRTLYLAALDERVRTAAVVGWMSTLKPMIRNHVATHSFVHYLPGLAHYLDLPDLLGCMAPRPLMVQQCSRDGLYPLAGMREAVKKLAAIYKKVGVPKQFKGKFYDQPHVFSIKMQEDAFDWLDATLKP